MTWSPRWHGIYLSPSFTAITLPSALLVAMSGKLANCNYDLGGDFIAALPPEAFQSFGGLITRTWPSDEEVQLVNAFNGYVKNVNNKKLSVSDQKDHQIILLIKLTDWQGVNFIQFPFILFAVVPVETLRTINSIYSLRNLGRRWNENSCDCYNFNYFRPSAIDPVTDWIQSQRAIIN